VIEALRVSPQVFRERDGLVSGQATHGVADYVEVPARDLEVGAYPPLDLPLGRAEGLS
jgi:hypothetical protein